MLSAHTHAWPVLHAPVFGVQQPLHTDTPLFLLSPPHRQALDKAFDNQTDVCKALKDTQFDQQRLNKASCGCSCSLAAGLVVYLAMRHCVADVAAIAC